MSEPHADGGVVLSVIVAVDQVHAGARRSLCDILTAVGGSPTEVIAATREPWEDAPPGVTVVAYNSASRGDRFDRAAEVARGEIFAFTDDRVRLPAGWAARVLHFFEDRAVAVAGGPVRPRCRWRSERISAVLLNGHLGSTPASRIMNTRRPQTVNELTGSNLVVRRGVFRDVGGFQSPSVGGEAVRLCYKVRSLLERPIYLEPSLAVVSTTRRFPGPFLADTAAYGRARGDMARRFPEVAPLFPYAIPTAVALFLAVELALLPLHRTKAELIAGCVLAFLFLVQVLAVLFARGRARLGDRVLAALAMPIVSLTYGVAFIRGFFGPSLGEISPLRGRKRPNRILIINWRDVSHPWAGGAETYMHEIGRRWAQLGMDVGWLCQRHSGSARVELVDGIRIHRVGGRFTHYPLVALAYIFGLRGRYDLIIDCENGIPYFTPLYSRVPRVLLVHHVHRHTFRHAARPPIRWIGYWLEGWLMPRVYRNTPVVAVSASTRDDVVALGFRPDGVAIVHNGVEQAPPLERHPSREPRILYTGRLAPQKGVDVILRALPEVLRAFPSARLDIVGQGPDRLRLERIAWSLRLANHVRFHGFLPARVRDELAAQAWLAVCPSSFEGWGVSCVEANARGLPVVASNVSGLRDSVRDGETGILVPHGDAAAMSAALIRLIGDDELRAGMSAAGRRWAAEHSWDRSADELRLVVTRVMAAHRDGARFVTPPAGLAADALEDVQSNAG